MTATTTMMMTMMGVGGGLETGMAIEEVKEEGMLLMVEVMCMSVVHLETQLHMAMKVSHHM